MKLLIANFIGRVNDLIIEHLGEFGPLFVVGGLGLLLVLIAIPSFLFRKKDPLEKLREQRTGADKDARKQLRVGGKDERLERFSQFLEPQNQEELSAVRLKLIRAGYRSKGAVQVYNFAQLTLGVGLLALGVLFVLFTSPDSMQNSILMILAPGIAGYMAPKYWVTKRAQKREEEITEGFPDALDLMLVCVEAGQSLDQAIIRVAREIRPAFPALSEEFEMVAFEMKAGKDKTRVLRDMGERVGVQDVNSFVTVLIQSASFGTSIAEALRVYASEMRDKRVMRAEEKANKLPTKLTLGTMMFCVPPLLLILIGPSLFGIYQNLNGG